MKKIVKKPIEYFVITGEDICRLYSVLIHITENPIKLVDIKSTAEIAEPILSDTIWHPEYEIIATDFEKYKGTDLNEFTDFIKKRTMPIISVKMSYFTEKGSKILIELSTNRRIFYASYILVEGESDWVNTVDGRINVITNDLRKIDGITYYIAKFPIRFFLGLFLMFLIVSTIVFNDYLQSQETPLNHMAITFVSLGLAVFLVDKFASLDMINEFKLNEKYIDPTRKKMKDAMVLIYIISSIASIAAIIQLINSVF